MLPVPSLEKRELNGLPVLTDEALFQACGVRIAFTSREGGVSVGEYESMNTAVHVGDDLACVQRNWGLVMNALGGADASLIVPNQVHGTNIVCVDTADDMALATEQTDAGADAVVVRTPGVATLLNYADCLSLIIVAPDGSFAVVHAGWRGALAGIAGKTARALAQYSEDTALAQQFNAYIGPHIHAECFETSEDIAAQFADEYGPDVLADSQHVSLARAVSIDLMRAGMQQDRIVDAGICTMCHPDLYFSYRASGGVCGRHAATALRCE